ncbi:MAG: hypothetical protein R3B96_08625 [Pirellulaceae bacterium]
MPRSRLKLRNAGPSLQRFSMGMATMRLEKLARLVGMKFVPDRQESIALISERS